MKTRQFNIHINPDTATRIRLWAVSEGISIGTLLERELSNKLAQIKIVTITKGQHENHPQSA